MHNHTGRVGFIGNTSTMPIQLARQIPHGSIHFITLMAVFKLKKLNN